MRESVLEKHQPAKRNSIDPARSRKIAPKAITEEHPALRLQRTIGNQAVLRMPRSQEQDFRRAGIGARASRSEQQAKRNIPQADHMREVATKGVAGPATSLPHLEAIQRSFGNHDVSGVEAHTGPQATDSNHALHAVGYTIGNHVAFAGTPDLHTAAHEAAHVVQQRGDVRLSGELGQAGDAYERHADAVADRVVRGQSSEGLLAANVGPALIGFGQTGCEVGYQKKAKAGKEQTPGTDTEQEAVKSAEGGKLSAEARTELYQNLGVRLNSFYTAYVNMVNKVGKEEESKIKDRVNFATAVFSVALSFVSPWLGGALAALANVVSKIQSDKLFFLALGVKLIDNTSAIISTATTVGTNVIRSVVSSPAYKTELDAFLAALDQGTRVAVDHLYIQRVSWSDSQLANMTARFDPASLTNDVIYSNLKDFIGRFQTQVQPIGPPQTVAKTTPVDQLSTTQRGVAWIDYGGTQYLALIFTENSSLSPGKTKIVFNSFIDQDLKPVAIARALPNQPLGIQTIEKQYVQFAPAAATATAAKR